MGQGGSTKEEQEQAAATASEATAPAAGDQTETPKPPQEEKKETEALATEEAAEATEDGKKAKGKGKSKEAKEAKGKEGKSKGGKDGKGKTAKGKEGGGKGKEVAVKGKGKEKGAVKGSGPTAGGNGYRLNVKNLGKTTEDELKELFKPFGEVSMAEIKKNEKGESRGFGFVVLPGEEEGEKAAKEMNGKEVNGNKLNVAAAERRPVDEIAKGKGKGGYDMAAYQAMYAQQWAAYSQSMMYYQQYAAWAQGQQQSMWPAAAPDSTQEFEGSLKSISSRNGYGFIVCRETYEIFGRDVYLDSSLLPEGTSRGARLVFTVNGNEKGHPKAVTCKLAPQV